MIKFFNWILKFVLAIVMVVIVIMLGVYFFVDPNQFKETIANRVQAQTGHVLTLEGPLSWSFSPVLSLRLNNISLENQAPFTNKLLQTKTIEAGVSWESLFSGKLFLNLTVKDLNLHLEKNSKGVANWDNLVNKLSQEKVEAKNNTHSSTPNSDEKTTPDNSESAFKILLSGLKVENANISFKDQLKNKQYNIKQLDLSADHLLKGALGIPSAISLNFVLTDPNQQILAKINLKGDVALNMPNDELNITNASLNAESADGKSSLITGEAVIKDLNKKISVTGTLESKNLDIKPWLQILAIEASPHLPMQADVDIEFQFKDNYLSFNPFTIKLKDNGSLTGHLELATEKLTPQTLNFKGDFLGKGLRFNKILLDEIKGQIAANAGLIKMAPVTLQIANSSQHIVLQIDMREKTPKYSLSQEGKGFDIKHLLALFDVKDKLEGKTNLKTTLTASGNGLSELRRSLSGHSEIEITQGKFYGIDLIAVFKEVQSKTYTIVAGIFNKDKINFASALDSIYGIWKEKDTLISAQSSTPFNSAKTNVVIKGNIIHTPSLSIDHTEYAVTGGGTIDLANDSIQYQTAALLKKNPYPANDNLGKYLSASPLPIKIEGSMHQPKIRPDLKAYSNNAMDYAKKNVAKEVVQKTIEKKLEKTLDKKLDKVLGPDGLNSILEQVTGN
jgi:uncharacterized protein involved in outer membrane biogenesis